MSSQAIIALVSRAPIFRGLPLAVCSRIIDRSDRVFFAAGDCIIEAGAAGDAAYLITSGVAEKSRHEELLTDEVEVTEGAILGEMAMLIPTNYGSTVVAKTDVQALCLNRILLHELMQSDPSIAAHFVEKIRQRLTIFAEKLRVIDQFVGSNTSAALGDRS